MLKLRSVLDRYEASELSQLEASELLGVGERTFRRWSGKRRSRHNRVICASDSSNNALSRRSTI